MSSALDLPEIRSHLAPFLTRSELARCAQVCQDWNKTFHPLVWAEITLTDKKSPYLVQRELPRETLLQNSNYVHELTCRYFSLPIDGPPLIFRNLKNFTLAASNPSQRKYTKHRFIPQHHKTLEQISFNGWGYDTKVFGPLWKAIASCPRLQSLSAGSLCLKSLESWAGFRHLWSNQLTHRLCLSSIDIWAPPSSRQGNDKTVESILREDLGYSKIKQLELRFLGGYASRLDQQSLLLGWAPALESFLWQFSSPRIRQFKRFSFQTLDQLLKQRLSTCPKLVHLHVSMQLEPAYDDFGDEIKDDPKDEECDQIFSFLEAKSLLVDEYPLESLTLPQNWFGTRSWDVVKNHPIWPTSLTILDLKDAVRLPGSVVQEMLCTLPNLKVFGAAQITDMDVVNDPRPWVCLRLRKLSLGIVITATEKQTRSDHRQMFFERLGTLTSLKELLMLSMERENAWRTFDGWILDKDPEDNEGWGEPTDFSLKRRLKFGLRYGGLTHLKGLRGLERLQFFSKVPQKLQKTDLEWMVKHWPKLKVLATAPDNAWEVHLELKNFLEACHVSDQHYHNPIKPAFFLS
ncbi:hypothetical protein BGZ83_006138 [Gryganskiella cystojenkinii]|nr:hypothetical protein BGZ83_006138 [Gryganskiella cystojenkinii]